MNNQFKENLHSSTLSAIDRIKLSGDRVAPYDWDNASVRILNLMIAEEVISEEELLSALDARLKILGRESYDQHKRGKHPDHTTSPEALVYALHRREFTEEEERSIRFDHGNTISTFIDSYDKGDLRHKILDRLLTEQTPIPTGNRFALECFGPH